jgi:hypothetical protein
MPQSTQTLLALIGYRFPFLPLSRPLVRLLSALTNYW